MNICTSVKRAKAVKFDMILCVDGVYSFGGNCLLAEWNVEMPAAVFISSFLEERYYWKGVGGWQVTKGISS